MAKPEDENQLIQLIERRFPEWRSDRLCLRLGDDAALFQPRTGYQTILTCDWFLEGSHFLRDKHPADSVGWKCLARAVSDIAAMGGVPRCFLLSLAIPASASGSWLADFLGGLRRAAKRFDCELAGGDTTRREEILINVMVVGDVRKGLALRRSGAQGGDQLFVTGRLGEAELGLRMLRQAAGLARAQNSALRKHLYPLPQLAVGKWLAERRLASAMMDLSDGLSTDLQRLCAASSVGARIENERLPVSPLVKRQEESELALHGGDDYELLFAVSPSKAARIPREYAGVTLTRIGEITKRRNIVVEAEGKKQALRSGGWDPFRGNSGKKKRKS